MKHSQNTTALGIALGFSLALFGGAKPVCHCADTGVCVLPAGECDSVGQSIVTPLARKIALHHKVIWQDAWYGGRRTVFDFQGYEAWIVEPPEGVTPLKGRPWTWTMQWKTAFVPRTGVPELLKRGFHHVTIDTFGRKMDAEGLKVSKAFQDYLVNEVGFAPKADLIGMSWGGFFSVRYAAAYPECVGRIVLDNPLLDFGTTFREDIGPWAASRPADGNWTPSPEMPVNKAEAIAKSGIPVLLLYGDRDTVTKPEVNALPFFARVQKAGGRIRTICRPLNGHHPHGFDAGDATITDFFLEDFDPEPKKVTEKVNLLENGEIGKHWYTWLKGARMRNADPLGVFTAEGSVLKVSGADMGCVTTKEAFRDYKLTLEFRYVDNDVQLNKKAARDGGLLFHSTGADGAYMDIWMPSFEYNIIQGASGDLIVVGCNDRYPGKYRATGCVDEATRGQPAQHWDAQGTEVDLVGKGRIRRPDVDLDWQNLKSQPLSPNEKPVGEWNTAQIVCHGDQSEFYFNGMLVGHYYGLKPAGGRIQLQSEGFGIEYRNIVIEPLTAEEAAGAGVPKSDCQLKPGAVEVVIAADCHAPERLAAREMSQLLGQALGTEIPVVTSPTAGRTAIFLGSNVWTKAAGIDTAKLERDAFVSLCDGKNVYIAGRDSTTDTPEAHCFLGDECRWQLQYERATLFGVYDFLERYARVRMYFPGELGTIVPKAQAINVPHVRRTVTPDYSYRRWGYSDGPVPRELLADGMSETDFKLSHFYRLRGGTYYIPTCHGQRRFGFERRFQKSHPEYFAMGKDGKRMNGDVKDITSDGQFCQSSGIWDEIFADVVSYARGEPASVRGALNEEGQSAWGRCILWPYVDVSPQDGMVKCQCEKCQAKYDFTRTHWANELMWEKVCEFGRRLQDAVPEARVAFPSYTPYGDMPDAKLAFPSNVYVELAKAGPWSYCTPATLTEENAEIAAWAKRLGHKTWLWTYTDKVECFYNEMPDVPPMAPHAWGEYYKALRDSIFGAFSESEADRWTYNYLNYYVFSRVCWDTFADVDQILDEHYDLMYGAGAPAVKRFFESLESKWIYEIEVDITDSILGPCVSHAPKYEEAWQTVYTPSVLARYRAWLAEAAAAVPAGSPEARRIALVVSEFLEPMERHHAKKPIFVFNQDDTNFLPKKPAEEYVKYFDSVCRGAVTHFFMSPNAMRSNIDSKAFEPIWKALEEKHLGVDPLWAESAKWLHDNGIDPYAIWTKRAREKGVSPWLSMRMNDIHGVDTTNFPSLCTLWREHPEYRCEPDYRKDDYPPYAFDFTHQVVRDRALAYIAELLEKYDVDGFECDWLRFPWHFPRKEARSRAPILAAFMREVRKLADEAGRRRGHKVLVGVRVPSHPDDALALGMDPVAWCRERSVDWVVPCNFFQTIDVDLDYARWHRELTAANPDVTVVPGLDNGTEPGTPGIRRRLLTLEEYLGWCEAQYAQGAPGIYVFNFFDNPPKLFEAGLNGRLLPWGIRYVPKRAYPISYRDTLYYEKPDCQAGSLAAGKTLRFRLGEALSDGSCEVVLKTEPELPADVLDAVELNGVRVQTREGSKLRFPWRALCSGHNFLKIPPCKAELCDAELFWIRWY